MIRIEKPQLIIINGEGRPSSLRSVRRSVGPKGEVAISGELSRGAKILLFPSPPGDTSGA